MTHLKRDHPLVLHTSLYESLRADLPAQRLDPLSNLLRLGGCPIDLYCSSGSDRKHPINHQGNRYEFSERLSLTR
jgi:hypothetical protein